MDTSSDLLLGGDGDVKVSLAMKMANRHGMIAGATGTGKTVTLQIMAEGFSKAGVPVFLADIKGDLSGLAKPGKPHKKIDERLSLIGIDDYTVAGCPVVFWDVFGKKGLPVRTTISEVGPLLLSNLLELNDTQSGVLYAAFRIADDNGMMLLDLKDLRSMLTFMVDSRNELKGEYGNISSVSVGAIQRKLLTLEEQGATNFFGEPGLNISDLMITDFSGSGVISVLDVTKLITKSPRLYAIFLLWLLSELYETLPEVGDADKPKMVFFFDEAHMLFDGAPKALVDKVEQVVRLIRSKGVGIYFVSQSPLDVPEDILGQLGARVQHGLRAFTPKDRKVVRAVAQTFRQNPKVDTEKAVTELGIGEALISVLDGKGSPTPVERVMIRPPESLMGPVRPGERKEYIERSPLKAKYETGIDRESAYELLKKRAEDIEAQEEEEQKRSESKKRSAKASSERSRPVKRGRKRETAASAFVKSAARAVGSQVGRKLVRGLMGSLFGGFR